jgi:hypothetical protein
MTSCKIAGTKISPFFFLCFFSAKINFSLNYWFHFYCTFHSMTSSVLHQSSEIQFSGQILHIFKPYITFSCNLLNFSDVFFFYCLLHFGEKIGLKVFYIATLDFNCKTLNFEAFYYLLYVNIYKFLS